MKEKILIHEHYKTNLVKHIPIRKGNTEEAFKKADVIIEDEFATQPVEHAYLEPMAGVSYIDQDGVLTIVSPEPKYYSPPTHDGKNYGIFQFIKLDSLCHQLVVVLAVKKI